MKIIDSHCHLEFKDFDPDREEFMARMALELELAVNASSDRASNQTVLQMIDHYPFIYGTLGLHPHDCAELDEDFMDFLKAHVHHPKITAVGEIGLDYYKNYSPKETQQQAFARMANLAVKENKPLVIHSREAIADTLAILKEAGAREAVFHCFTGTFDEAKEILDRGYLLSFSGVLTYPKNTELEKTAAAVPLDRFLLETDAPFLAPVPMRGKRNEPAFVRHTAQKFADLRNLALDEVIAAANANARWFFKIG